MHLVANSRGRAGQRQGPGLEVLVMAGRADVAVAHLHDVVEDEAEPAQTQAVELLEHGRPFVGIDPLQPCDLPGHRLDGRPVEMRQQLRGQRLVQADQHDRGLAHRGDRGREWAIGSRRECRRALP